MSTLFVNKLKAAVGSVIDVQSGHELHAKGHVIQFQRTEYDPNVDSYTAVAASTLASPPYTLSFTPKFATSKLFIQTEMHTRMANATGCTFGIYRDNVKIPGMVTRDGMDFFYKGEALNHHYTGRCECIIDANSTSATVFKTWGQGWDGSWEISYGHGRHSITVMEIAQ